MQGADSSAHVGKADWLRAVRYCVGVYVTLRIALFGLGVVGHVLIPNSYPVGVPTWPAVGPTQQWHHAFTAWERWDALWYLSISSNGYRSDDASAAFFPLYPLLSRAVAGLLGDRPLLGAYVVSNLALVVALVVLYRLTALEFSEPVARLTTICVCVLPTGFFLFAPYTESLFLALSVGSLYAARRHCWLAAGAIGALAASTRSTGLLLAVPLGVEALLQLRQSVGPLRPRLLRFAGAAAACASVSIGLLLYLAYWRGRGEWSRPLTLQESNYRRTEFLPWDTLQLGWQEAVASIGVPDRGFRTLDFVLVAVMLVAGAALTFRIRPTYAVYFWVSAIFPLLLIDPDRPLQSVPRYYLVVFPIAWGFALLAHRARHVGDVVVPVLAMSMGVQALLFVAWYPVF